MPDVFLWDVPTDGNPNDIRLDDPTIFGGGGFPTQFAGLRTFYNAAMKELCLVAEADAPVGMGGVIKVLKGITKYAVYLVETSDPNASHIYIRTTTGTKAVRLKT